MIDLQPYKALDGALIEAAKDIDSIKYVSPANETDEKKEFLDGRTKTPRFQYDSPKYDTIEIGKRLRAIEVPDDTLGRILDGKRNDMILENIIIANLGDREIVRGATITRYGVPNEELVAYAEQLLREIPAGEKPKTVASSVVLKALEDFVQKGGIKWRVGFSNKRATTNYPGEELTTVCEDRMFSEDAPQRLGMHEIGVHAFRAANGYEQDLQVFAIGVPGYMKTEEGLTAYFEEQEGYADEETMRGNAAKVIAIDSVVQGLDFKQTFDRLKSFDLSDNKAWTYTVRAHRAGGFIKDHIYLEGLLKVRDFAENDGDFKTLYVGKVGVEDISLVRELLYEGVLREPRYLPWFVK